MSRKTKDKTRARPSYAQTLDVADCTHGKRVEEIAAVCGVDLTTARRWKSGKSRVPKTAALLLTGDLGAFSSTWRGWHIIGDEIVSPDGWRVSRNDALAVPLLHGQISAMRREIEALKEGDKLEEQPTPDAWHIEIA